MATPLVQLLRGVIDDPAVRAEFADGPMDYLSRHGYEHLDAADVREALMIMADGAPTSEAVQLHSGGEAIDPAAGDGLAGAAAGLGSALGAIAAVEVDIDPADLDGLDDVDDADAAFDDPRAADGDDGIEADAAGDTTESSDPIGDGDSLLDVDDLAAPATGEPALNEPAVDQPALDDAPFAAQPDSAPDDIDGSDDWDDVL